MLKKIILFALLTANTLFLTSCILSSVVSTTFIVANDRRSAGEIIDDNSIKFSLLNLEDEKLESAHLNFLVYRKNVLITGEAPDSATFDYISAQVPLKNFKIKKTINEVRIAPNSGVISRVKDTAITGKIEVQFLNQEVFNPVHIKVTTENRRVYLMGDVTSREGNKASKIASQISGVEKVVVLFNYLQNRPAAEITAEKHKQNE